MSRTNKLLSQVNHSTSSVDTPNCCLTSLLFRSKFFSMSDIRLSHAPSPPMLFLYKHLQALCWWNLMPHYSCMAGSVSQCMLIIMIPGNQQYYIMWERGKRYRTYSMSCSCCRYWGFCIIPKVNQNHPLCQHSLQFKAKTGVLAFSFQNLSWFQYSFQHLVDIMHFFVLSYLLLFMRVTAPYFWHQSQI